MIKIINNLSDYDIPKLNESIYAYILTGEDSCSNIKSIIEDCFGSKNMLIKASGMLDNIIHLAELKGKLVYFEEGDSHKIFIKKFPELLILFCNFDSLDILLEDWTCACYERRIIYILNDDNTQSLIEELNKCKFDTSTCFHEIWRFVDAVIENVPESPEHDTFLLVTKKHLYD